MIKIIPFIVISLLTSACVEETKNTSDNEVLTKVEVVEKEIIKENIEVNIKNKTPESLTLSKSEVIQQKQTSVKKRTVTINHEKFTTTAWPLTKGSKVYNLSMHEPGKVTGDFVVVIADNTKLPELIQQNYHVINIAKSTYKLTPKIALNEEINEVKKIDLMAQYKILQQQQAFKVLEMSVDYSGSPEREAF